MLPRCEFISCGIIAVSSNTVGNSLVDDMTFFFLFVISIAVLSSVQTISLVQAYKMYSVQMRL